MRLCRRPPAKALQEALRVWSVCSKHGTSVRKFLQRVLILRRNTASHLPPPTARLRIPPHDLALGCVERGRATLSGSPQALRPPTERLPQATHSKREPHRARRDRSLSSLNSPAKTKRSSTHKLLGLLMHDKGLGGQPFDTIPIRRRRVPQMRIASANQLL